MNTSEIEKKLVEMDKQLHDILNMIEERKKKGRSCRSRHRCLGIWRG